MYGRSSARMLYSKHRTKCLIDLIKELTRGDSKVLMNRALRERLLPTVTRLGSTGSTGSTTLAFYCRDYDSTLALTI